MHEKRTGIRILAAGCVAGLLIGMYTGCAQTKSATEAERSDLPKMIVGGDDYPPFYYEDADGRATGIDVDIATEACRRMGYQAEFSFIDWEDKKQLLKENKVDCIWSSFAVEGREEEYTWTEPYMQSWQAVAVNAGSDIHTLMDLADKRIVVQAATKSEEIFCKHTNAEVPKMREVISLTNRELMYSFLSKGYVDALATNEIAIRQYMKDYDLEYRILDEPVEKVGLAVAFDKNDTRGLDRELSDTLQAMRQDGTLEKILGKYLDDPQRYLEVDDAQ